MDLLSPEALGGAGVSLGAVTLYTLIRALGKFSAFIDSLRELGARLGGGVVALKEHLEEEKRHHRVLEENTRRQVEALHRLDRAGAPRLITADHTPITSPPHNG